MTSRRFTPADKSLDNMRLLYGKTPEPVDDSPEDDTPPNEDDEGKRDD